VKICLTGASGFIGSAISRSLLESKSSEIILLPLSRRSVRLSDDLKSTEIDLGDLSSFESEKLQGCDSLIHAAARAHVSKSKSCSPLSEYRKINRDATLELARLASNAGIKRFVFLSSIGVNGASSKSSFTENAVIAPHDDYSLSKYEAEIGLLDIAKNTGMEVVIIRPPLVYGPGAPGNFKTLVKWVKKSIPMPFGSIHNCRSFIALDNLIDFVLLCADKEKSPKAANEVFLISDGEDVSTSEFLSKVSSACGVKSRLIPMPIKPIVVVARLLGREDILRRLFGNLQVDSSKARELLNWRPVVTMDKQLSKSCEL